MTAVESRQVPFESAAERKEIHEFVGTSSDYYVREFSRLFACSGFVWSFNLPAAIFGPIWFGARNLWAAFCIFLFLETLAIVQISRGFFGDLGAEELARATRLSESAARRQAQFEAAVRDNADNVDALRQSATALEEAAHDAFARADALVANAPQILMIGVVLLLTVKFLEGMVSNWMLARRFDRWRADRTLSTGVRSGPLAGSVVIAVFVYATTAYRFTSSAVPAWLTAFPADSSLRNRLAIHIEASFEYLNSVAGGFFTATSNGIKTLLDGMEMLLVGAPWPVVMVVIVLVALLVSGSRVAIFTAAGLLYLAFLGFWERSMETVALLGSAAILCIAFGIPLGIACARRPNVYTVVRPILDFMQTMPAFVYLIPVIAFFGIGKPPGILATIVFGMPPVVRLTVLGLQGVPDTVREAAVAFGASKTFLLFKVDIPLALPTIMAGINQTILMCLSMVVIASLIGAKGLGQDVLDALTYAAEGHGVLAGLGILFCAMILDRIVQGGNGRETR